MNRVVGEYFENQISEYFPLRLKNEELNYLANLLEANNLEIPEVYQKQDWRDMKKELEISLADITSYFNLISKIHQNNGKMTIVCDASTENNFCCIREQNLEIMITISETEKQLLIARDEFFKK